MPKSMRENLSRVTALYKPGHTWWFVTINGKYVGNIPGAHYAGAVKRAAKIYAPDMALEESDLSPPQFPTRANQAMTADERRDHVKILVEPIILRGQ
jgi:hypothetical protein